MSALRLWDTERFHKRFPEFVRVPYETLKPEKGLLIRMLFGDAELSTTTPDYQQYLDKMLINRIYLFLNEQPYQ